MKLGTTLAQWLGALANQSDARALREPLQNLADRVTCQTLSSPGLAIKTAGSALAKAGSLFYALVAGLLVKVTANTDMAALSGTVTNAKFNVFCFFIDSAGTLTSAMGVEGATLAAVTFPPIPNNKAMVGFVIINPTGTGNFTGGTTPLDDATVVPNAAYVNTVGVFDPTLLPGSMS